MNYIVIIADLKKSREKIEKYEVKIKKELDLMNTEFDSVLVTSVEMQSGDEIQFMIEPKNVSKLFALIRKVRYCVMPLEVRIGIGIGGVYNYSNDVTNPFELNGDAFYNARFAIEKNKKPKKEDIHYNLFYYDGLNENRNLNAMLNAWYILIDKWKNDIYTLASLVDVDLTQKEVAKIMYVLSKMTNEEKKQFSEDKEKWIKGLSDKKYNKAEMDKFIDSYSSNISKRMRRFNVYDVLAFENALSEKMEEVIS